LAREEKSGFQIGKKTSDNKVQELAGKSRDKKTLSDDDMYDEDFDEEIEEDLPKGNNYAEEHDQAAYSNHIGASGQAITVS
jgi:hypothetical protein